MISTKNAIINDWLLELTSLIKDINNIIIGYYDGEPQIKGEENYTIKYGVTSKQFRPYDMETDGELLYICNKIDNTIYEVSLDGKIVRCWGKKRNTNILKDASYLAIYDSELYVVDNSDLQIKIFCMKDKRYKREIGVDVKHSNEINGICVHDSRIYVGISKKAMSFFRSPRYINIYTIKGKLIRRIDIAKIIKGHYPFILIDLCVVDDEIYMVGGFKSVICLSLEGKLNYVLNGTNNNGFVHVSTVKATDESIYIGDNCGIHQFDRKGNFIREFGKEIGGYFARIMFINNKCYALNTDINSIFVFK